MDFAKLKELALTVGGSTMLELIALVERQEAELAAARAPAVVQQVDAMQELHDAIMRLPCDTTGMDATHALSCKLGHRNARHAAAELAAARAPAVAVQVDALTDDELFKFWLYRDCISAIQAGDMRGQFISAARAILAATRQAGPMQKDFADLTDAELADPDYMRSYVESCHETCGELLALVKKLEVAPVQAAPEVWKHWCETCDGAGTIDQTLGGEWNSNPKEECPDCSGKGYWVAVAPAPRSAA